jgi:2-oxo-4-hydroxy-4-carboxy-5-ureidoimidazoline decarboxylase
MTLGEVNALDAAAAARELLRCCGSTRWAEKMTAARPFVTVDAMMIASDAIWSALDRADWLEAFGAHPKIGTDARLTPRTPALPEREALAERSWSAQEQAGVASATDDVLDRLAAKNREYEARFGYIFIVCATGKSAAEMLRMLEQRLTHDPDTELRAAAGEQRQITRLRLAKLLGVASAR